MKTIFPKEAFEVFLTITSPKWVYYFAVENII